MINNNQQKESDYGNCSIEDIYKSVLREELKENTEQKDHLNSRFDVYRDLYQEGHIFH